MEVEHESRIGIARQAATSHEAIISLLQVLLVSCAQKQALDSAL